jgi:hypothetical protein
MLGVVTLCRIYLRSRCATCDSKPSSRDVGTDETRWGSPTLAPQLNLDAFIAQARAYDAVSETELGEMLKSTQTSQLRIPSSSTRTRN